MDIKINKNSDTPLYIQIRNEIRNKIISNEILFGFKLPTERSLAESLNVSRNTIVNSYQSLIDEGLIVLSNKPKGYFVREPIQFTPQKTFSPLQSLIKYTYTDKELLFDDIFSQTNSPDYIPFAGISVDSSLFQTDNSKFDMLYKLDSRETNKLKQNICHLLSKQNMLVDEKHIEIVSETTQAIEYIIELYLNEGDYIIVEEPVSANTINIFRNRGIKVVCVKMEDDGMCISDLEVRIKKYHPKFIYTLPTYHNPSTITMSVEKRIHLLKLCNYYSVPIIEENSLHDFHLSGPEYPTLFSLDRNKSVLYLDTFNLSFLPGIKTAFIVGPVEPISMIGKLIVTNQNMVYNIGHAVLNEAIEDGSFTNRVKNMQQYYRKKRDYFCEKLNALQPLGLDFNVPEGGPIIWCKLPTEVNEKQLFKYCKSHGLLYMPGTVFYPFGHSGRSEIRLCFSNVTDEQIDKGVKLLGEAIIATREQF